MKKLTLEMDALAVESFATAAEARGEGTVRGFSPSVSPCTGTLYCLRTKPTDCPCTPRGDEL